MVTHYREDQSAKRKLEDSLNGTPAKKAKMNGAKAASESSDDSSSDESEDEKPVAKPAPKAVPGIFYKIFYSHMHIYMYIWLDHKGFLKMKEANLRHSMQSWPWSSKGLKCKHK